MLTDILHVLAAASLLVGALTWASPGWALTLLVGSLPFFTHHPATPQTLGLIVLVSVLEIAYAAAVRPSPLRVWRAIARRPLLLLGALYVVAAFLSLSSLPLIGIWSEHAASSASLPWGAWPQRFIGWMQLTEVRREFSITSAVLTLQGYVLALIVWRETRVSSALALRLAGAITAGTTLFAVVGLLEMFGMVSLETLRGTGSVFVRQGTLQSTAGNPGWFSQWVVYALPYSLVLLAGVSAARLRAGLLAITISTMAFALVLCFQRGGWIAGAVMLIYIGLATGLLRARADAAVPAAPRVWRGLALAALGLAVAAVGLSLWLTQSRSAETGFGRAAYVGRLKSIADADRMVYVRAASMIAALHPVLGGGHESFAYRYQMYFDTPGGLHQDSQVRPPVTSSAHNVFMQTMTGTGAVGMALLVAMFAVAASMALRVLRSTEADRARRAVVLTAGGSLLAIVLYGLVQEVFYVHALRLLFFIGVGLVAGAAGDTLRWPAGIGRALWLGLAVAFAVHLGYEYVWPGPERLLPSHMPTGLFGEERGPRETRFRWSSEWATWPVPPGTSRYVMRVRSVAPFPQEVVVQPCDGPRQRVTLPDHAWYPVEGPLQGCGDDGHLQVYVSPAWRPPGDERLLGVMTADVQLR